MPRLSLKNPQKQTWRHVSQRWWTLPKKTLSQLWVTSWQDSLKWVCLVEVYIVLFNWSLVTCLLVTSICSLCPKSQNQSPPWQTQPKVMSCCVIFLQHSMTSTQVMLVVFLFIFSTTWRCNLAKPCFWDPTLSMLICLEVRTLQRAICRRERERERECFMKFKHRIELNVLCNTLRLLRKGHVL